MNNSKRPATTSQSIAEWLRSISQKISGVDPAVMQPIPIKPQSHESTSLRSGSANPSRAKSWSGDLDYY